MGFLTTMTVYNDALHKFEEDRWYKLIKIYTFS